LCSSYAIELNVIINAKCRAAAFVSQRFSHRFAARKKTDVLSGEGIDTAPLIQKQVAESDFGEEQRASHSSIKHSNFLWIPVALLTLTYSYLISVLIPFFSDLQALIGAFGTTATTYTFPIAFALQLLDLKRGEKTLLQVFLGIALVLHVLGMYSAVSDIISKWQGGTPFMCDIP